MIKWIKELLETHILAQPRKDCYLPASELSGPSGPKAGRPGAQGVLEAAVEALGHPIRLRVVGCGLLVLNI